MKDMARPRLGDYSELLSTLSSGSAGRSEGLQLQKEEMCVLPWKLELEIQVDVEDGSVFSTRRGAPRHTRGYVFPLILPPTFPPSRYQVVEDLPGVHSACPALSSALGSAAHGEHRRLFSPGPYRGSRHICAGCKSYICTVHTTRTYCTVTNPPCLTPKTWPRGFEASACDHRPNPSAFLRFGTWYSLRELASFLITSHPQPLVPHPQCAGRLLPRTWYIISQHFTPGGCG